MKPNAAAGFRVVVLMAALGLLFSHGPQIAWAQEAPSWEKWTAKAVIAAKKGEIPEARRLCGLAMELVEKFDPQDPRLAKTHMLMGEIHRRDQRPELAERSFSTAVAVCEKTVGPRHRNMIDPLEALANFYYYANRLGEVGPLYRQILDIVEQGTERNDGEVAVRTRNLAEIYRLEGRYAEVEPLYEKALALAEKTTGSDKELLAGHLLTNADFYRGWCRFDRAESLALRALALREMRNDRDGQLALGICLDSLAEIYLAWDKPAKAESLYRRSMEILGKIAGPENPDLAPRLCGLAAALKAQEKHDEAGMNYQKAIRVTEQGLGLDVPELVPILERYAAMLHKQGKAVEANARLKRAASIRKQTEGS